MSEQAAKRDRILGNFAEAWRNSDDPPDLGKFAQDVGPAQRRNFLLRALRIDLERRWASYGNDPNVDQTTTDDRGFPLLPRIEDYLQHFPDVGRAEDLPLEVVLDEYNIRLGHEDRSDIDAFVRRFPHLGELLREALHADQTISQPPEGMLTDAPTAHDPNATVPPNRDWTPPAPRTSGPHSASSDALIDHLRNSGLLTSDDLKIVEQDSAAGDMSAADLVESLKRRDLITEYQAAALLKGESSRLVLGDYVLLSQIGQGGMGQVFKARHRRLKRLVALKLIPDELLGDADAVKRFEREMEATAQLQHRNIITAYDAREDQGIHYLVAEYVEGRDLSQVIKSDGVFAIKDAVDCIHQAAEGLEWAHQHGIIHRDIKPSNLMLTNDGVLKILDMGLARIEPAAGSQRNDQLTRPGMIIGTVNYMSPEQASDTRTADERSDIYSLGCTLYFLLTGRAVYEEKSMMRRMLAHRDRPIPSIRDIRPEVSQPLDDVFATMVAKKPADRYRSMTEVLAALDTCRRAERQDTASAAASAPQQSHVGATGRGADGPYVGRMLEDRYQLKSEIASGAFGSVYEATDLKFDSTVAVKLLINDASGPTAAFRREAQLARRFKHPNVVEVYDYGTDNELGVSYIVMEYLNGAEVGEIMAEQQFVSDDFLYKFVDEVGSALQNAHDLSLVHRDLKPANIILVDRKTAKERFVLLDLGIATKTDAGNTLVNKTMATALTPKYASPEQLKEEFVGAASDIYSFGTILYQMLAGRHPFDLDTVFKIMTAVNSTPPPPFSEIAPQRVIDEEINRLVFECLEKDPRDRPQSMADVRSRFLHAMRGSIMESGSQSGSGRGMSAPPSQFDDSVDRSANADRSASAGSPPPAAYHTLQAPGMAPTPPDAGTSGPASPDRHSGVSRPASAQHSKSAPTSRPREDTGIVVSDDPAAVEPDSRLDATAKPHLGEDTRRVPPAPTTGNAQAGGAAEELRTLNPFGSDTPDASAAQTAITREAFESSARLAEPLTSTGQSASVAAPQRRSFHQSKAFQGLVFMTIAGAAAAFFWPSSAPNSVDAETQKIAGPKTAQRVAPVETDKPVAIVWSPPELPAGAEWRAAPQAERVLIGDHEFYDQAIMVLKTGQEIEFAMVNEKVNFEPYRFYMMKDMVWNDLFRDFVAQATPQINWQNRDAELPAGTGRLPATNMSANEAHFCAAWLGGRLPTTTEWDLAAGFYLYQETQLPAGWVEGPYLGKWSDIKRMGTIAVNSRKVNVGESSADVSPIWGCRDMAGNGQEFTCTTFNAIEGGASKQIPVNEEDDLIFVHVRSRSFNDTQSGPCRYEDLIDGTGAYGCNERHDIVGFRIVVPIR